MSRTSNFELGHQYFNSEFGPNITYLILKLQLPMENERDTIKWFGIGVKFFSIKDIYETLEERLDHSKRLLE